MPNSKFLTTAPPTSGSAPPARPEPSFEEEAARYCLLRRLAPAIRHHLVGEFQPIGMVAAMMERRLQAEVPNLASVRENCASLGSLSRTAAGTSMNLMTWISPKGAGASLPLESGVAECLGLLATEFRFRGFVLLNEIRQKEVEVQSTALRSVLPAALLAMVDAATDPLDIVLTATPQSDTRVQVDIAMRASDRPAESSSAPEYRALRWADVQALANAEKVELVQTATGAQMVFTAQTFN
ncbi:MAG: hypothetical protein V4731_12920 [Pseudomonadota bacterium]